MKYTIVVLIVVTLCACFSSKKNVPNYAEQLSTKALPVPAEADMLAPVTTDEPKVEKPQPFSRIISNGTYYDVTDLFDLFDYIGDTSLKSLRINNGIFSDLSPLAALTELEDLRIAYTRNVVDISPLSSLANLRKLELFELSPSFQDITPLSSLSNLRYLRTSGPFDCNFRGFASLPQLEVLSIGHSCIDVSHIARLTTLRELYLEGYGKIVNIEHLQNLKNLKGLSIYGEENGNLDLSWIPALQELEYLHMPRQIIADISPLALLPRLVEINLYLARVENIEVLLESKSIKEVSNFRALDDGELEYRLSLQFWERGISFYSFVGN
ncbi:MAG: hypothetical protein LBH44_06525 [Treponema sp.]|nr:hypothetical protein [Treponema sp.]